MSPFLLSRESGEGARDYTAPVVRRRQLSPREGWPISLKTCIWITRPRLHTSVRKLKVKTSTVKLAVELIALGRRLHIATNVKSIYACIVKAAIGRGPRQAFQCWSANDEDK